MKQTEEGRRQVRADVGSFDRKRLDNRKGLALQVRRRERRNKLSRQRAWLEGC